MKSVVTKRAGRKHPTRSRKIAKLRVYPGADADFELYQDDGTTYDFEQGKMELTRLHWSNARETLQHSGAAAWSKPDAKIVEIIHTRRR